MPRTCIFCGETPVTREHVVPRWVSGVLNKRFKGSPPPFIHKRQLGGQPRHWSGNDINVVARCVCRRCKTGWMADIERRALPLLSWMISGRPVSLSADNQTRIAAWIALHSLLTRYINDPVNEPEKRWRRYFYVHKLPPPTCYQWLAAYQGDREFHYQGYDLAIRRMPGKPRRRSMEHSNGINVTFVIGNLITNLIWVRKGKPGRLDAPGFVRVWPVTDDAGAWPPSVAFDDTGVDAIARRFLSAPPEKPE